MEHPNKRHKSIEEMEEHDQWQSGQCPGAYKWDYKDALMVDKDDFIKEGGKEVPNTSTIPKKTNSQLLKEVWTAAQCVMCTRRSSCAI